MWNAKAKGVAMFELMVEAQFDSAHSLRGYEGACESLHGHTYRVQARYRGEELNEIGILVDFKMMRATLKDVVSYLDHKYLNELPEFKTMNPTTENIAKFIYERMRLKLGKGIALVSVWETPTSSASYFE